MILFKWVERGLGLVSTVFLVRLLSPGDFGMISMALSFIFMAEMLASFSFDVALIQNQSASVDHYHSAWTANVMLGGVITLVMLALALPITHFYKQPALLPVICALSLGPLFGGLENIGVVAFRKDLDFRKEFIFQVSRKVLAFCTTIPLAFLLNSYWALVAGILVSKGGGTAMSYWVHPFRPRFSLSEMGSLLRFSKWLLLNNLVIFFKERSTDFVIGRFYGPAPLGVYNVSNEFASLPCNEMGAPINRALFPGLAKMAGQKDAMRTAFANASGLVAILAVPAGFGIFAVAPFMVPVVLGKQWLAGVPVMEILSINSSLLVFHGTITTALIAAGKPSAATRTNLLSVVIMVAGLFTLTGRFGSVGAAYSVLIACVASTPIYLLQLRKYVDVPLSNFLRVVMRPLIASIGIIAAVRLALPAYNTAMTSLTAGLWLAAGVALGTVVYGALMLALWYLMGRPDGAEQQVLDRIRTRVPAWVPLPAKQID
ncbi:MAG: lipopolysaccharide biosynthesis protein [Fibrobacterota bacterium]|nr:lipopolysaccharide biosynthesis protein [Fibrobacterota bacterium]